MQAFTWKLLLATPIDDVYDALATDQGRAKFWAERTEENNGIVRFYFPNGESCDAEIVAADRPLRFCVRYFDALTDFLLADIKGKTELTLKVSEAPAEDWLAAYAGWVSVLMNMKAVLDHGADLRNHDPGRSWDHGFVDN